MKLFLMLLLSFQITTPVDWTEQKKTAVVITSLFAATGIGSYLLNYLEQPAEFYVKNLYPHAQLWYEDMIVKYPQARLDQKRFLQSSYFFSKEYAVWSVMCNNIYCPQGDLVYLEAVYTKKINDELLDDAEILFLNTIEWLLLHEAGHSELNYSLNEAMLIITGIAALEACKAFYKESTDDASKKYLESVSSPFFTSAAMWSRYMMMTYAELCILGSLKVAWVRDQEAQADNFANKHATSDALLGGVSFFERVRGSYQDLIQTLTKEFEADQDFMSILGYFNITAPDFAREILYFGNDITHPTPDYRIQTIRDEIACRLQNQEMIMPIA